MYLNRKIVRKIDGKGKEKKGIRMGEISRWIKYSFSLNVLQDSGRQLKLREQSKSKVNVKGEEYAGWKNEEKRVKWNSFCAIWFPFEANFQRISQFVSKIEGSLLEYFKFSHLNYPIYNRKTRIFVASKNYATFPNTFSHLYKKKNFPQSYTIHRINTHVSVRQSIPKSQNTK